MAYRIPHPARPGVFFQDSDDDGEAAAGGRLLRLLQLTGAGGDGRGGVCVVVTRWFGGVLLGPSRFALINNCARALLVEAGAIPASGGDKGGAGDKSSGRRKKGR